MTLKEIEQAISFHNAVIDSAKVSLTNLFVLREVEREKEYGQLYMENLETTEK